MKNGWFFGQGIQCHYANDELHRLDGPAIIEYCDGCIREHWYYEGEMLPCTNQEDFEKMLKLKAFL